MKKFATIALVSAAFLTLAGCGSSKDASSDAMADDVEVPADQAMSPAEAAGATPVADAHATDDAEPGASASAQAAGDAAAAAAADFDAAASDGPDSKDGKAGKDPD